mmetsp:Transcript_17873/g.50343  ORF Transcript_17873/g.50343 Transcript_17873/m.50343 type:complete len:250 (-) Transcript_17873:868-1617(-)
MAGGRVANLPREAVNNEFIVQESFFLRLFFNGRWFRGAGDTLLLWIFINPYHHSFRNVTGLRNFTILHSLRRIRKLLVGFLEELATFWITGNAGRAAWEARLIPSKDTYTVKTGEPVLGPRCELLLPAVAPEEVATRNVIVQRGYAALGLALLLAYVGEFKQGKFRNHDRDGENINGQSHLDTLVDVRIRHIRRRAGPGAAEIAHLICIGHYTGREHTECARGPKGADAEDVTLKRASAATAVYHSRVG